MFGSMPTDCGCFLHVSRYQLFGSGRRACLDGKSKRFVQAWLQNSVNKLRRFGIIITNLIYFWLPAVLLHFSYLGACVALQPFLIYAAVLFYRQSFSPSEFLKPFVSVTVFHVKHCQPPQICRGLLGKQSFVIPGVARPAPIQPARDS